MRFLSRVLAAACSAAACAGTPRPQAPAPEPTSGVVRFEGTCDASGAVPLDERFFAVADDEDNVLRIYDAELGGPPLYAYDLSQALELDHGRGGREADLEAATHLGDHALWLTSHARSKKGKRKDERLLFFVTEVPQRGKPITLTGKPHRTLAEDLIADPRLAPLGLEAAAERSPAAPGGFNLEGLTATPEGQVMIGFRNPLYQGRAILVPILNPLELAEGRAPRFGDPLLIDLGGRGVRALSWWRGKYLVLAGSPDAEPVPARLFTFTSSGAAEDTGIELPDLNPEGFFTPETRDRIMVLSDDGAVLAGDRPCKKQKDRSKKSFRGLWVTLPSRAAQ